MTTRINDNVQQTLDRCVEVIETSPCTATERARVINLLRIYMQEFVNRQSGEAASALQEFQEADELLTNFKF